MAKITYNVGDLFVIWLVHTRIFIGKCIAELVQTEPLILKAEETGEFCRLTQKDFVLWHRETMEIQGDEKIALKKLLKEEKIKNKNVFSGLKRLGVKKGKIKKLKI